MKICIESIAFDDCNYSAGFMWMCTGILNTKRILKMVFVVV